MNTVERFERRDWTTATILFAACIALRVPFRCRLAYHWDSAQFALAIRHYDLRLSQPHAPGYFLYVMLGRLLNFLVDDPHASLVWLSVIAGSALAGVMYLLGAAMFDRRVGWAAGLFAMTSPQMWFHSCVALTYSVDSFFVCLVVLWCWRGMSASGSWLDAFGIGVLVAMVGGVRQQTVPTLAPLILYTFWKFRSQRLAKLSAGMMVALLLSLAWFVPMVKWSGGLATYLEIVKRHTMFNAPATLVGGGLQALLNNVAIVSAACWSGMLLGAVALTFALLYRAFGLDPEVKRGWDGRNGDAMLTITLWVAPMVLVGTVLGFTKQSGYVLNYLTGLMLLCGLVVAQLRSPVRFGAATAAVCVVNIAVFVALPQGLEQWLCGVNPTATEIREHDQRLARTIEAIRSHFAPGDALVCYAHDSYLFGFRHFQLHMPEFDHFQIEADPTVLTPPGKALWCARDGCLTFVAEVERDGKTIELLIVPPRATLGDCWPRVNPVQVREVTGSGGTVYAMVLQGRR